MKEMVGGCCVCSDERGWPDNPLVYCDGNGCTVAVHQACYGIVTVPTGPWFCRKCESPETKGKVRCELCPSKSGALKRTDTGGWAHVVCALYIPEVRFGNVTSMEPIVLRLIPPERYNKTCYICHDLGKSHRASAGACMQCNKSGCKQQFHVTCAQSLGLLCEEAGNYLDNVKYCGYCQHHYSKLKKGGNVKTIPPYKPVSHDSQSSDSSEKEGEASPMASGSGTPTHPAKAKGPGRKSSHNSGVISGKNTPNASKTPTSTAQPLDKKKPSPSRRGSSAGDAGGSGSKGSTPAPSPQHTAPEPAQPAGVKASGGSTPSSSAKVPVPAASPNSNKPLESVGVISSVASATASVSASSGPTNSTPVNTSVVQTPTSKTSTYQESVITNTESVDTKQTKKRKAVSANTPNTPVDYAATPPHIVPNDVNSQSGSQVWESGHQPSDVQMDTIDKVVKKAKTEEPPTSHFSSVSPAPPPPPPPPAHSPASQPSPRHLPSPMPGPSGLNTASNIRSPSQPQAAMEPSVPGHSPHGIPGRSTWGGLNVSYEMQQDPNKPSVSSIASTSKDTNASLGPMPPAAIRNKKRAAVATSVVAMANTPPPSTIQTTSTQNLANVRRPPQPTPPPIYQEIKDSPPSSPSSERPLKPKMELNRIGVSCTAPHMLGNELNPESGAAARLQEQLSAELAAHAAGSAGIDPLVPPPLINKAAPNASSSSGRGGSTSSAQSLDQLLERQWEQGSQFLMEQAQHFDIASLLSCLHQLRTENVRLEEHVGSLLQRRDHLLAVNARLAIPLTTVSASPPEPSRCPRENGSQARATPAPLRPNETVTSDRAHQAILQAAESSFPGLMGVLNSALGGVFGSNNSPFLEVRIRELLFDGIPICANPGFIGALACAQIREIGASSKNLAVQDNGTIVFSLLSYKEEVSKVYKAYRGINNSEDLGLIISLNGSAYFNYWVNDVEDEEEVPSVCNMINGTDSGIFNPFINRDKPLYAVNTDICRSVELRYQYDTEYEGIPALRFAANEWLLNNEDGCFCLNVTTGINKEDGCLLEGATELYSCVGAPLVMSYPHFLFADSVYSNGVIGLNPEVEEHRVFLDLEPNTGTIVRGAKRAQFNIFLRPIRSVSATNNLNTKLTPIVWFEEGIQLPEEFVNELRNRMLMPLNLVSILLPIVIALCCVVFIVGVVIVVRVKLCNKDISK